MENTPATVRGLGDGSSLKDSGLVGKPEHRAATGSKEALFGAVAEPVANAEARLHPAEQAFVLETPAAKDAEGVGKERVGHPKP